jgi:serine/threonine protein kinase
MEEDVQHSFVRLVSSCESETPWYSMEPVFSGLTLEKLYLASQVQDLPIPEELAFHIIDQVSKACLFLHKRCKLVRVDTNRQNLMLRYPGRKTACMPDVVLIDWSLWENANAGNIAKDTENVYECLFPIFFEAGWRCREAGNHRDECSTINGTPHSLKWLELCKTVSNVNPYVPGRTV